MEGEVGGGGLESAEGRYASQVQLPLSMLWLFHTSGTPFNSLDLNAGSRTGDL